MVSLPIDLVSHPKIPVSLRCETSETGGSVSLFREKKFRYVSLQFRFEAKFGDTLVKVDQDVSLRKPVLKLLVIKGTVSRKFRSNFCF